MVGIITHPYDACLVKLAQRMPENLVLSVSVGTQSLETVVGMKGWVWRISANRSGNSGKVHGPQLNYCCYLG